MATSAGLTRHSWKHSCILLERHILEDWDALFCNLHLHVFVFTKSQKFIPVPMEFSRWNKGHEHGWKNRHVWQAGESLAHLYFDEIIAVLNTVVLINVALWTLHTVRTTARLIKLLWCPQDSGEGHRESLRKYRWTALNCSKSVPLHTFSL